MKGTILQPTYLPWLGYFEMMAASDLYVAFDHVQFESKSWQQRNFVKGPNGKILLSIPIKSDGCQEVPILKKRIDYSQGWVDKHLRTIEHSYRKAKHFGDYYPKLREVYCARTELLPDFTLNLIHFFTEALGIEAKSIRSSSLVQGNEALGKTERVINLCKLAGIRDLYDGKAAADFIDLNQFQAAGLTIEFQNYVHPLYPQMWGEFIPNLSVLDLLMNCGRDSLDVIKSGTQ